MQALGIEPNSVYMDFQVQAQYCHIFLCAKDRIQSRLERLKPFKFNIVCLEPVKHAHERYQMLQNQCHPPEAITATQQICFGLAMRCYPHFRHNHVSY